MFNQKKKKNINLKINDSIFLFIELLSESNEEKITLNKTLNGILLNKIQEYKKNKGIQNIFLNEKIKKEKKTIINQEKTESQPNKQNIDYIDEDGFRISNGKKLDNIFDDLNIADFVITFPNPFFNININNYKLDKNISNCYFVYRDHINLTTLMENLEENDLHNEKIAFINSLLFFSEKYFGKSFINFLKKFEEDKEIILQKVTTADRVIDYNSELEIIKTWNKLVFECKNNIISDFFNDNILINIKTNEFKLKFSPKIFSSNDKNSNLKISDNFFKFLVKKVIILKFNKLGIFTRQTYNNSNSDIFLILKCQNSLIYERAEVDEVSKQLEVGKIDLISLEPIDKLNRPFKLKNFKLLKNMSNIKLTQNEQENLVNNQKLKLIEYQNRKDMIKEEIKVLKQKYKEIKNLSEEEFLKLLKSYNSTFIKQLDEINKDLELKQVKNKEILIDLNLPKKEWDYYLLFLINFNYWYNHIGEIKKNSSLNFDKYEGLFFRLIFKKALGDVNDAIKEDSLIKSNVLKTIWSKLNFKNPIGPFIPFNREFKHYFRTFEINELHKRSYFLQYERIKLTYNIINDTINIFKLFYLNLVKDFFPLHDQYILNRQKKEKIFSPIFEVKKNKNYEELFKFFQRTEDEADFIDFEEISLVEETKLQKKNPMSLPIQPIRNYFGEKIALYFYFVRHWSFSNFLMIPIGLLFFILYFILQDFILKITMAILILIYSTVFIEFWKRKEKLFALEYGQLDFEEKEFEIPSFRGNYIRDVTSNNYNLKYYPQWKKNLKYVLSFLFSLLIICFSISITIGFLYLRQYWKTNNSIPSFLISIIPSLCINILIFVLNRVYLFFAVKFNFFENHNSQTKFEDSLILKIFFFNFFNTFNQFIIIAFVRPYYPDIFGNCIGKSCVVNELRNQVITFSVIDTFKSFLDIVLPFFFNKLRKILNKGKVHDSKWNEIDQFILQENDKNIYMLVKREIDGIILDYMQLVLQFSFISLFSLTFELTFILAWLTDILQMHFDKLKLYKFIRRPIPNGASDIGTWMIILNIILYISIFFNSALISYVMIDLTDNNTLKENRNLLFVLWVLVLGILKIFIDNIIPDFSSNFQTLLKRHENLYEKLLNINKKDGFSSLIKAGVWMDPILENKKLKKE